MLIDMYIQSSGCFLIQAGSFVELCLFFSGLYLGIFLSLLSPGF